MARLFDDGSNEYLQNANAVVTDTPASIACWMNTNDDTVSQSLAGVYSNSGGWRWLDIYIDQFENRVHARHRRISTGQALATAAFTANTWHHICGVFASGSSRSVYIDGGNKGTNTTSLSMDSLSVTNIGVANEGSGFDDYFSGAIAETAIWNVALTDAEVASLAVGYSPLFVQPQSLVTYWRLIRDEDQDIVGGYDLTAYNTPSIASHPPVIYPVQQFIMPPSFVVPTRRVFITHT